MLILVRAEKQRRFLIKRQLCFHYLINCRYKNYKQMQCKIVRLNSKYQVNNYLPLSPFPSFVMESA